MNPPADSPPTSIARPPLGMPFRIWWGMFAGCGLAVGILNDAMFDDAIILAFLLAGVVTVAIAHYRRWSGNGSSRSRNLAVLAAFASGVWFGGILIVIGMLAIFLAEVLVSGKTSAIGVAMARFVFALFLGSIVLLLARKPRRQLWNYVRLTVNGLLAVGVVVGLVLFVLYTGPEDLSVYPPQSESPYRLPWQPGIRRLCCQGNRAIVSHRNWETFAYDFVMPVGTEVCAARGGVVVKIVDHFDGNGYGAKNNEIAIWHDDATIGRYLHFRQYGARVRVGQRVTQGEVICASGNVGHSMGPHLHFEVMAKTGDKYETIPITFADVPGDGIPRILRRYTSGNGQ